MKLMILVHRPFERVRALARSAGVMLRSTHACTFAAKLGRSTLEVWWSHPPFYFAAFPVLFVK